MGRRTGTGYEVWYARDEGAGNHKVLQPHGDVLYKSGVYALKGVRRETWWESWEVAFLASEEAGFITGQTLVLDGGQTLPESLQALAG